MPCFLHPADLHGAASGPHRARIEWLKRFASKVCEFGCGSVDVTSAGVADSLARQPPSGRAAGIYHGSTAWIPPWVVVEDIIRRTTLSVGVQRPEPFVTDRRFGGVFACGRAEKFCVVCAGVCQDNILASPAGKSANLFEGCVFDQQLRVAGATLASNGAAVTEPEAALPTTATEVEPVAWSWMARDRAPVEEGSHGCRCVVPW